MHPVALPDTLRADIAIWRIDLDLDAPVPQQDWALLSADEEDRARRFVKRADCVRHACTRAALRRLLARHTDIPAQALRFTASARGKPRLVDDGQAAGVEFNVSHAGAHALIAISARVGVGVDIERCDPSVDTAALEALVLSPQERQMAATAQPGFFERWVVKEAALKAVGAGVAEHLQALSVAHATAAGQDAYLLRHDQPAWTGLSAWRLAAPPGYLAAVAVVADQPISR